ncbi:hypothetical protein ACFQ1S_00615 [Kibdelosporangium lantanae]|uniref:Uncharacterized protein n=1 Tax=Kibdelosporangium lantanae TaxID=1497396 RepID=A0ABW3M2M9_9PSEU
MPERSWNWAKRITWGEGRTAPLDFGKELWKWDVSLYESADGIRASLVWAGRTPDDDSILFEATHSLISDVVDAAGGAEQAHRRFCDAMDTVHETYVRWQSSLSMPEGSGMTDPSVEAAWYALEELIVWARVLDDRLKRRPVRSPYRADQGLIPALANGPRRDAVITARTHLLQGGVEEARYLSNLSLHMQSSRAGSKSRTVRSGTVVLPFPDRVTGSVAHRWELTYDDGRDAASFTKTLMSAIERFMDEMISALEMHVPERFKTTETVEGSASSTDTH